MASVRKLTKANREGKFPWVVEYTDATGKRRRATPKSGLKKDADALRRKIEGELDNGAHVAASQTATVAEATAAWLEDCERRWKINDRMAGTTLHKYRDYGNIHIVPGLGHLALTDLTHRAMQEFINAKRVDHKSSTVATMACVLKRVLDLAVERGWLRVGPLASKALRVPGAGRTEKKIPSRAELQAILVALFARGAYEQRQCFRNRAAIVLLATFAGLRRGEICGLQWENVDLDNDVLNIRHSLSIYDGLKGPKSAAGIRPIPLAPPVAAALRDLRAAAGADPKGYVLRSRKGGAIDPRNIYAFWRPVMRKSGLLGDSGAPLYTFHALRHANVSLLIARGLQPFHIQKLVGHASISTTMDVYGHMFPDDETSRTAITAAAAQFHIAPPAALISGPHAPV